MSARLVSIDLIRLDGGTQMRDSLDQAAIDEYAEHLSELPPVLLYHDGANIWPVDGFHRIAAHVKAGKERIPAIVEEGTLEQAKFAAATEVNKSHGVRRSPKTKRKCVETVLLHPLCPIDGWKDREVARLVGVGHQLVADVRAGIAPSNVQETASCDDSVEELDEHPDRDLKSTYEDECCTLVDEESDDDATPISEAEDYDSDEWYTPDRIIDLARTVMGGIDLDPASCEMAQSAVQASTFYTKEDDGLAQEWGGRVWLNPPYSQPLATQFADKLRTEVSAGRVQEAVFVINSSTDARFWHSLADECAQMCLTKGRINFNSAKGGSAANRYGQTFFYFGPNVDRFRDQFGAIGLVGKMEKGYED